MDMKDRLKLQQFERKDKMVDLKIKKAGLMEKQRQDVLQAYNIAKVNKQ